jgi:hypothetical protein
MKWERERSKIIIPSLCVIPNEYLWTIIEKKITRFMAADFNDLHLHGAEH